MIIRKEITENIFPVRKKTERERERERERESNKNNTCALAYMDERKNRNYSCNLIVMYAFNNSF